MNPYRIASVEKVKSLSTSNYAREVNTIGQPKKQMVSAHLCHVRARDAPRLPLEHLVVRVKHQLPLASLLV